jgi:hypothetical protein
MTPAVTDKKTYLKQLLKASASFKTLPEKAKADQAKIMLSGSPEEIDQFIKILEEEKTAMNSINEDFLKQAGEIEHLVAEAKQLEVHAKSEIRHEKEEKLTLAEQKTADTLLKQLEKMKGA